MRTKTAAELDWEQKSQNVTDLRHLPDLFPDPGRPGDEPTLVSQVSLDKLERALAELDAADTRLRV